MDLILEDQRGRCIGIEIKSAASARSVDFDSLRWFGQELGNRSLRGFILHAGEASFAFANNLYAILVNGLCQQIAER